MPEGEPSKDMEQTWRWYLSEWDTFRESCFGDYLVIADCRVQYASRLRLQAEEEAKGYANALVVRAGTTGQTARSSDSVLEQLSQQEEVANESIRNIKKKLGLALQSLADRYHKRDS